MLPRLLLPYLVKIGPTSFRRWVVDNFPSKNVRQMKEIVDVIERTTKEVYYAKKTALVGGDKQLAMEVAEGNDIMTVLRTCHLF